jgi:K+-transporting ATPase KdpF subunit
MSMAKVSLQCGQNRRRTSGMGYGEIAAGLIGIVLLVYLGYALVFPEKF